jgi:hypothetical protein
MRDYYLPPTDHPKALEMESIQTKLDAKRTRMGELEVIDRDWTAQEEDEYRALEDDVRDLDKLLDETWENRRG